MAVRKLVVCCDGTWNTPRTGTNIVRTYDFLRERLGAPPQVSQKHGMTTCSGRAKDGSDILLYYDEGVGTNWFTRLAGGGVGAGLSDNVQQAYHFLANNYQPGSEIYVFGFSRGAYTARSLCGFMKATGGLLEQPSMPDVWRAYIDLYATGAGIVSRPTGWNPAGVRDWLVKSAGDAVGRLGRDVATLPRHAGAKVKFIGVYDTVGALGVPLAGATKINEPIVGFHDTTLGDRRSRTPCRRWRWTRSAAPTSPPCGRRRQTRPRWPASACFRCGSPACTPTSAAATRTRALATSPSIS